MKKNYFITLLFLTIFSNVLIAQNIWEENFNSYAENSGIEGDGAGNVANIGDYPAQISKWSLDAATASLFNNSDWAKTIGGALSFRDTDGTNGVFWNSEAIDISSASGPVSFQLTVSNNSGGFETGDFINVSYSVDGGTTFNLIQNWNGLGDANTTILGESNGQDWSTSETILQSGITGTSLLIRVQVKNNASAEQFFLDDISVFEGAATPSLSITSPTENTVFNPETTSVDVSLSVANFTVASGGTGDGYIQYSITGGTVQDKFDVNDISFTSLSSGNYAVNVELVDNSGNSLSPAVSETVNFSIASYTTVADLAALRAGTEGNYYNLTGEVIYTFEGTTRNQKFIQDVTAAILIDDNEGVITTQYNIGDGITGIKGKLGSFRGVTQFVPTVNTSAATSNGNTVTPVVVSVSQLLSNLNDYESEFVTVNDVNFTAADGTTTFASGTNYDITDGTNTMVFRTHFTGTDIDGSVIPTSSANITGIAGEYDGTSQIFGISLSNIVLGTQFNEIQGFAIYPNPVNESRFIISSNSTDQKEVSIYNVLGKNVFNTTISGTKSEVNIPSIAKGMYILKVVEANKTATSKLIIR